MRKITNTMSDRNTPGKSLTGSYIVSLMSIMVVLFLLGLFAILMMHAGRLSAHIMENIGFEIVMNNDTKEANILRLQKELDAMPAVKSTEYITKDEAISRLSEDLGEDFLQWLGDEENPLLPSIDVRFNAAYANNDSLSVIEAQLAQNQDIKEIYYQKSLIDLINKNVKRIAIVLLVLSAILLIIAVILIRNTIRLSVYSKRLLIRSMQLVGATRSFIRQPFVGRSVLQGFIAALIAVGLLAAMMYALNQNLPELSLIQNQTVIISIYVSLVIFGILLSAVSTFFALNKYLNADIDKIYN